MKIKNLLLAIALTVTSTVFAQESYTPYMSAGVSVGNSGSESTFTQTSYPSIELGVEKGIMTYGLVLGTGNLDKFDNYWAEVKTSAGFPLGSVEGAPSGYGLLGIGNYLNTSQVFVEYGAGISYVPNKVGIYAQASNWDGIWYVTTGLIYKFK